MAREVIKIEMELPLQSLCHLESMRDFLGHASDDLEARAKTMEFALSLADHVVRNFRGKLASHEQARRFRITMRATEDGPDVTVVVITR